jgi:transposase
MPCAVGRSRPWRDHRQAMEGIVYRYRTGIAWRDLLERFGPWQTVLKRHRVIPEPGDQKAHRKRRGSAGGRPVSYDRTAYRGRNVIERAFNGSKHWRGLATRYDKHAVIYRGGLVLAAALTWAADLGDTS